MAKPAAHFFVNGVVAQRDKQPYIQFSTENGMVAQLTIAQAQQVAADILTMAARTEMDAMVLKFFTREGFPDSAGEHLMTMLRDYRAELDAAERERVE